jgi:uroporphyrinogen decarboxylase
MPDTPSPRREAVVGDPLERRGPHRRFLEPLAGRAVWPPPIWLMRQAGRYLPEYRATRKEAGGFLQLCYTPRLAAEVTLQPIRRYGFDAAILFSDILVVPDALGQPVRFEEGEGPKLDPLREAADLTRLDPDRLHRHLTPVYETVARLRQDLPAETALIGFCGAPWTVATYMISGEGSSDQAHARTFAYRDPDAFGRLIDILVEASIAYLGRQIEAGADVVQIFDSWAGSLPEDELERWVIGPTMAIVAGLAARHPTVPVIGFPRGVFEGLAQAFVERTGVSGVSCDTSMPLAAMRRLQAANAVAVQGNLDPLLLVAGGVPLDARVDDILAALGNGPFIFNLGHGIVPQTPPEHVARLVERVRRAAPPPHAVPAATIPSAAATTTTKSPAKAAGRGMSKGKR